MSQLLVEFATALNLSSSRAQEVLADVELMFLTERATELWEDPFWTAARNNIGTFLLHSVQIN